MLSVAGGCLVCGTGISANQACIRGRAVGSRILELIFQKEIGVSRITRCLCFLTLLSAVGCQGLEPGKMEWVQTHSDQPRAGNVYLIRGLIGVFSTGMDELSTKIETSGVRARVFQDNQHSHLAAAMIKAYSGAKNPEPLVLIGHSYGADDVVRVARELQAKGIRVDLMVTFDATTPPKVPGNVAVVYNYFQSQPTDVIPMFRGIPLTLDEGATARLVNMDLRKDRKDLLEPGTNHINIDKNSVLQDEVVKKVLEVCVPRETWVARRGSGIPVNSGVKSQVKSGGDAKPAGAAE